ncbi:hypothetical protein GTO10_05595 [Candidatus Saccharibacteria bacterium]|nr:hypothetical protein [Candidatus Saccharibacteria bacterium]
MAHITVRKIEEMKEVCLEPKAIELKDSDEAYWVIREPGRNLTIFAPYRLGREFPKTYGHFHVPPYEETYKVLYGKAAFLIQKMEGEKVSEVQFKVLEEGESFTVPLGFGHTMLNLGDDYVITMDDHDPKHFENDYSLIKKLRGFAYYIVEKDGGWESIPNENYKNLPPLKSD